MVDIILNSSVWILIAGLGSGLFITATKGAHIQHTAKGHAGLEIQSAHSQPTPRIGGVSIVLSLLTAMLFLPANMGALLGLILIAALPIFAAGFCEDIGIGASPKTRLVAAMLSAAAAIHLTGYTVTGGLGPGFDSLLSIPLIAAGFTIFITAGICHAFNLIDGLNGLALSVTMLAGFALTVMALTVGDTPVAIMGFCVVLAAIGVFALNYPLGKLFLGDAGAYGLGFLVAMIGVSLLARNPDISAWAVLLTVLWPCIDTAAAILRRLIKGKPLGAPDKMHFHHVVKRLIEAHISAPDAQRIANPLATLIMLPMLAAPPLMAIGVMTQGAAAFGAVLLFMALYAVMMRLIIRYFRKFPHLPRRFGRLEQSHP